MAQSPNSTYSRARGLPAGLSLPCVRPLPASTQTPLRILTPASPPAEGEPRPSGTRARSHGRSRLQAGAVGPPPASLLASSPPQLTVQPKGTDTSLFSPFSASPHRRQLTCCEVRRGLQEERAASEAHVGPEGRGQRNHFRDRNETYPGELSGVPVALTATRSDSKKKDKQLHWVNST